MFEITLPALRRGRSLVLQPMELRLPAGSLTGIVGPNGAGKSTLLRAIAGLSAERAILRREGRVLDRSAVGFLPQSFTVRANLSVLDCVLLGRREGLGWSVPPAMIAQARDILACFGLADLAARGMNSLSGGQQQRVLLVQRLFRNPQLLALDEPTSARDLHHQLGALAALRAHARQSGTAVIAALHDLTLAARFCDRVLVLGEGRLICQDTPEGALTPERVAAHWRVTPELLRDRDACLVVVPHTVE
ncbi:ABC transporter ATP-binding protein [Sinirhodobacter sp. WL0062]|uniref:ABC transporter ATP-binding protein n=1 Tax=Rhodobacter flavimaris TaxID=2907145 RepID=A0ABS8YVY2_9RHOB|nr:ABC transporter ATP-binding protein [Sinirhodobacter sp. WL0062]MCE5972678.1 ABC transporter ATP-binding protein [Sinirhodobacter sp. WL0062]